MEVARGRSAMMDSLLHRIFLNALQSTTANFKNDGGPPPIALLATGGYGRNELSPYSDVDILFVLPNARGPELALINASVEQVLYALWDLGLKVGHATRTIGECLDQAGRDMQSATALIEARLLDGAPAVFTTFQDTLNKGYVRTHVQDYIAQRLKDQAERHARFGGTVFVQEPNLKNGCGGLRDLQSLLWIARFKRNTGTVEGLRREGLLSQLEAGRLTRAYDFIMRTRNELHYANGRAMDEITLSAQPKIAEALGYRQKDILQRIEIFMRDYYRHARDIFLLTEACAERLAIETESRSSFGRWSRLFSFTQKTETLSGGLILENGVIECGPQATFPADAHDLMQIFRTAQLRDARIGGGVLSLIRNNLKLVKRPFLYASPPREIFLSILRSKGEVGRILRAMHECGFLGKYLPEFGRLDCLVQHEFYHRYTADEHTLVAIEKLDEALDATTGVAAPYSRIFQRLESAHLLYLAILLHDTGKAVAGHTHADASTECASRVARRFCLDPASQRTLLWLVDHHMSMSSLAQRRDIEDPSTIDDFRKLTGTSQQLDMLHLLTFVDGQAVGTSSWNEWRQSLLWQIHEQTTQALNASGVERVTFETRRERLRAAIVPRLTESISQDEVPAHFASMPRRYWMRVEEDELLWHFEILHAFFENLLSADEAGVSPVVRWRHFPDRAYSEVVVCSWDRHGLFAKIAGSFAAARINILNADIYTRSDDLVLDIFQVCDLDHRAIEDDARIRKMADLLTESLKGAADVSFAQAIQEEYESMRRVPHQGEERFPTQVVFDNEDSADYTILEIQTPDRLGLLHQILQVLTGCGLDIGLAKINTEKGAAMDVFYLTDTESRKITNPDHLAQIQKNLVEMIGRLNAPYRSL